MLKVAIIGTVPVSRRLGPYNDPSFEIWPCSPGNRGQIPPSKGGIKWFELHPVVSMCAPENEAWAKPYFEYLNGEEFPVYMQEKNDLCPRAIRFPIDLVIKRFGRNFLTSSVAMMIGFAIILGAKEIAIFGVDMAATEEYYGGQKAGCLYMIEKAREAGIIVTIPLESCLGQPTPIYGYEEASRMGRKLLVREEEAIGMLAQLEQQMARLRDEICFFKGNIEGLKYMRRTFTDGQFDAELDAVEEPKDERIAQTEELLAAGEKLITHTEPAPAMSDFVQQHNGPLLVPKATTPSSEQAPAVRSRSPRKSGNGKHAEA